MKNYISKLNDRNLQRKRETGLTTYALFSLLFFLLYRISILYPSIPFKTDFWEVVKILTYTANGIISVLVIYGIYEMSLGKLSAIRLITKKSTKSTLFEDVIESLIFIIPLILNVSAWFYEYLYVNYFNWYFIIASVLLLLVLGLVIYFLIKVEKIDNSYDIISGTGQPQNDRDILSIVVYLFSFASLILALYYIYTLDSNINKTQILRFGVVVFLIPVLLNKIVDLKQENSFTASMENLEYEINVKGMEDEEIKIRLQEEYMGFLLSEWVSLNINKLTEFKKSIDDRITDLNKRITETSKVNATKYAIEYEGRMQSEEREQLRNFYIKVKNDYELYDKKL